MARQISEHLNLTGSLSRWQSGFRPRHSCDTALLKITTDIRTALDDDRVVFLVLLDFTKAFDSVDHAKLLLKLKNSFGFGSSALKLLKGFLTHRSQRVKIDEITSPKRLLYTGVPQGSILGPLLFSLFINDLPSVIKNCSVHLYADDVQIYLDRPIGLLEDCVSRINEDLQSISQWSENNNLILNSKKSQALVMGRESYDLTYFPPLELGRFIIPYVSKAKNLGIMLNSRMSCCDHVNMKLGQIYGVLRRLWLYAYVLSTDLRIKLVKTLILPHITHGSIIYPRLDSRCKRKLEIAYNDSIRFAFRLRRYDHISPFRYKILDCSLEIYLKRRALLFLHQILYNRGPAYLYDLVNFLRSNRRYDLLLPRCKHSVLDSSFLVQVGRIWNALPVPVQRAGSTASFKRLLWRHTS